MSDILFLDALNPPAPAQLVADMREVGATAIGFYVLRRDASGGLLSNGTWTPGHIVAARAAGFSLLPIVVPGSSPLFSDIETALDNVHALGCPTGPIALDIETFSFPPASWVQSFIDHAQAASWTVLRYGDVGNLAGYPAGDGDWISHGYIPVGMNRLLPMPGLPQVAGIVADQYTVGVQLNGTDYDGSVFSSDVFGLQPVMGGADMAAALRPDGSAIDYFVVRTDGSVDHYLWTFANGMHFQENLGGGLLSNSLSALWVGVELVLFGQAPDGSHWQMIWDGTAWGTWTNTGVKGGLPVSGPKGDMGPAGPPGPAGAYVRHTHQAQTDTGSAVGG